MHKIQKVFIPNTEQSQGDNVQTLKLITNKDLKKANAKNLTLQCVTSRRDPHSTYSFTFCRATR